MANSIPISGLNPFSQIETGDFIALVESSSMTTYRTSVQGLFDFMATTASCLSASHSITSSYAITSSYSHFALSASRAISSSHSNASNFTTIASSSISSSYASSASVSSMSFFAVTSSTSTYVRQSDTASYLWYQGSHNGTASFAISSSWARDSSTASYALSIPSSGAGTVPVGTIVDFAFASCTDTNWMICDGSPISRTTYATLFSVIGTTWGVGDGSTTFNIPDLRKRITLGARFGIANSFTNDAVGDGMSMISGTVGSVGGGEAYQYHYHLINMGNVTSNNDDITMLWLGKDNNFEPYYKLYAARGLDSATRNIYGFFMWGSVDSRAQPSVKRNTTEVYTANNLGTSFSINDVPYNNSWFTSSAYPNDWYRSQPLTSNTIRKTDLSMPYAITNKIIRVL